MYPLRFQQLRRLSRYSPFKIISQGNFYCKQKAPCSIRLSYGRMIVKCSCTELQQRRNLAYRPERAPVICHVPIYGEQCCGHPLYRNYPLHCNAQTIERGASRSAARIRASSPSRVLSFIPTVNFDIINSPS